MASTTHSCGHGLFGHHLQGVHHRDVAKPPGNGQGSVPVLARGKWGLGITSHSTGISTCVSAHVSSVQT